MDAGRNSITNGETLAVDSAGGAYVTGETNATDFITTTGALRTSYPAYSFSAFVTKISTALTGTASLVYSTYLGGKFDNVGYAIALDSAGDAYVAGTTGAGDFPTTANAFQTTNRISASGGSDTGFVSVLNPTGSALLYSTYLGGSTNDYINGIAVDNVGDAYVTGETTSSNFPTKNALQGSIGSPVCGAGGSYSCPDAFVAKLNPTASGTASLVYSTYLGGNKDDNGIAIAVDTGGDAYVAGYTTSTNLITTTDALQGSLSGSSAAFVTELGAGGLVYSTYLGGNTSDRGDYASGIAVDAARNVYVSGSTDSTNFPTANALQAAYGGGSSDAFVVSFGAPQTLSARLDVSGHRRSIAARRPDARRRDMDARGSRLGHRRRGGPVPLRVAKRGWRQCHHHTPRVAAEHRPLRQGRRHVPGERGPRRHRLQRRRAAELRLRRPEYPGHLP